MAVAADDEEQQGTWSAEVTSLVRGAAGGFLFGIPLLYTMEVWWVGRESGLREVLLVLFVTFVVLFVLNQTAGFRTMRDVRVRDALVDSVKALALGLALVAIILVLLREVRLDTPLATSLAKVGYEAMPFCIGVGLARQFLSGGRDISRDEKPRRPEGLNATVADLGASAIGAVFIALNVAPTDEIPMVTAAMSVPWLLALMAVTLAITYAIVFVAGFTGQEHRRGQIGWFQHPVSETLASYLVSLLAAALMLLVFQRLDRPVPFTLAMIAVLGMPAAVGGAAGRLAV